MIIKARPGGLERRAGQELYLLEHSWGLTFKDKQASTSISVELGLILEPEHGLVNSGVSTDRISGSLKVEVGFSYVPMVMSVSWHTLE